MHGQEIFQIFTNLKHSDLCLCTGSIFGGQTRFLVDRLSIYFTKHNYKVSTRFIKESKRYKEYKIKKFHNLFNFSVSDQNVELSCCLEHKAQTM